jgi:hypothetical protein
VAGRWFSAGTFWKCRSHDYWWEKSLKS